MFNRMKVGTRLIAGFLTLALLGALVAAIGIYNMSEMNARADRLYKRELLGVSHVKEANINLVYIGRAMRTFMLASTEKDRETAAAAVEAARAQLAANMDKARQLFVTENGKRRLADAERSVREYEAAVQEVLRLAGTEALQENRAAVEFMLTHASPKGKTADEQMTDLSRLKEENARTAANEATSLYESSRMLMMMLVLGSVGFGVGLGVLLTRGLTRQLGGEPSYAADIAGRIAAGDLTVEVALRPGDSDSMLAAMKTMRDSLARIVGQVRRGTEAIAAASSQIAIGNMDLSTRTEEQASSLEETASSMEELTSTVQQNADNARQANGLATTASEVAERGGMVVSQVVDTMAAINDSSKKIVDIIGVIDGIAFQTNILALNAAVEAARAGEQGRGFAVVASEVRTLAQRSASAAKEIKGLIDDSVAKVDTGAKLVDNAGATMDEVVASVRRVTDIMGEISSASLEQTSGIEQINMAVVQMDQVTQQNASLVEEAAAAAESLQDQAAKLARLVAVFKVGDQGPAPAAAVPAHPAPAVRLAAPRQPARAAVREEEWETF